MKNFLKGNISELFRIISKKLDNENVELSFKDAIKEYFNPLDSKYS